FFIACADVPYFSQFGSHINKSVMVWRMSAGYSFKLVFSSFHYWGFFLLFLLFSLGCVFTLNKFFREYNTALADEAKRPFWKNLLLLLITGFFLFAFARGRLTSKSTMHEGMSIVSQNAFVNQIALNANFTLIKSLSRKEANKDYLKNIEQDLKVCKAFYPRNYFPEGGVLKAATVLPVSQDSLRKLNVVVVLMESLNMSKMGYHNHKNLSPYLTELAGESVFFDRFFSSGIHTFNGLFSTASGFPSVYTEQGLRQYTRQPFTTLANLLKPFGYQTYFCTTHDAVFDNMEGFFKLNGFDKVISESDFSMSESIGVTGVPDHLLYAKLVERVNKEKGQPFVAYVMTGTDHGPWHIPSNIPFKPDGNSFQENASMYADWAVKRFIEDARKHDWYKNTVFVFLGDHGQIMDDPYQMPITYHHIPCIVHCPSLLKAEQNHNLGYQPDIVKTVASLLKLNYANFSFGENVLEVSRPFVFFSADDKLGYVTSDDYFFFHCFTDNQKRFVKYKDLSENDYYQEHKRRADSLYSVAKSLYNSVNYYIQNNYAAY
ncbi:MAG: LTA synthase family protein, partial [Bacteroidia bacterium]|nr:LTA synthase family protein [Bacteroidia bacterium]